MGEGGRRPDEGTWPRVPKPKNPAALTEGARRVDLNLKLKNSFWVARAPLKLPKLKYATTDPVAVISDWANQAQIRNRIRLAVRTEFV